VKKGCRICPDFLWVFRHHCPPIDRITLSFCKAVFYGPICDVRFTLPRLPHFRLQLQLVSHRVQRHCYTDSSHPREILAKSKLPSPTAGSSWQVNVHVELEPCRLACHGRRDWQTFWISGLSFGLALALPERLAMLSMEVNNAICTDPCSWTFRQIAFGQLVEWRWSRSLVADASKFSNSSKTAQSISSCLDRRSYSTNSWVGAFLISWAMPAVSWPSEAQVFLAAINCDWWLEAHLVWISVDHGSLHWSGRACFQLFPKSINRNIMPVQKTCPISLNKLIFLPQKLLSIQWLIMKKLVFFDTNTDERNPEFFGQKGISLPWTRRGHLNGMVN